MRATVLPDESGTDRLLASGEYAAIVCKSVEYATNNATSVPHELLDAIQQAIVDEVFDADVTYVLASDLAVLRACIDWT